VAEKLSQALKKRGADVQIINGRAQEADLSKINGLIYLCPFAADSGPHDIVNLFRLTKKLNPEKVQWVYGISSLGGEFGNTLQKTGNGFLYQGVAGFIKSLSKEWHHARCRHIDLNTEEKPAKLAEYIFEELLVNDALFEVGYNSEERKTYEVQPRELKPRKKETNINLDKDSLILALGGAKGITAEASVRLAKEYGCRFVLVGRSTFPEQGEDPTYANLTHKADLRKAIIQQGKIKKPAEIEKRVKQIISQRQINHTLHELKTFAAEVEYISLDVIDDKALSKLIKQLYKKHGKIDGVLHGAGIIEDKFLQQKTPESFNKVFSTKVNAALTLEKHLKKDVQFVVFFSSVASAFGNKGQIDYSSANDTLDKLASSLNNRISGRAFSINWGPWADTGMVSKELKKEYEKAGIGLIPLKDGVNALIEEIRYGNSKDTQIIIMSGSPEAMMSRAKV